MDGTTDNSEFDQGSNNDGGDDIRSENSVDCESAIGSQNCQDLTDTTLIDDVAEDDNLVDHQQDRKEGDQAVFEVSSKSEEWQETDEAPLGLHDIPEVTQEIPHQLDELDALHERDLNTDHENELKHTDDDSSQKLEMAYNTSDVNDIGEVEKLRPVSPKTTDNSHILTPVVEPLVEVDDIESPDSTDIEDAFEMGGTGTFGEAPTAQGTNIDIEVVSESPARQDSDSRISFSSEKECQEDDKREESVPPSPQPQYDPKRSSYSIQELASVENIEPNGMEINVAAISAKDSESESESESALESVTQEGVRDSQSSIEKAVRVRSEYESSHSKSPSPEVQDCSITISEADVQFAQIETDLKPSLKKSEDDVNVVPEKKELRKSAAVPKRLRYSTKLETHIDAEDKNDELEEIRIEDMPRAELEQLLRKTIRKRTQWIFVALLFLITSWILACTTAVFVFNYRSLQDACGDPNG